MASGRVWPHQQAGHMIASDPIQSLQRPCKSGAVHIWVPSLDRCESFASAFPRHTILHTERTDVRVFALDSNRYRSGFVNSNAVGQFGRSQLATFRELLFAGSGPAIVATHHHITKAHDARRWGSAAALGLFLVAIDGPDLIDILRQYARAAPGNRVLVIHGHKHQQLFECHGDDADGRIFIYGHPSSTMGIESSSILDGLIRFAVIGLNASGEWAIDTRMVQQRPATI